MGTVDAFWHVTSFFAPAFAVGLLTTAFAKLLWRRELKAARWSRLCIWSIAGCCAALVAGLVVFGQDGKMATYMAMLMVCSAVLWWRGFARRRR